MKICLLEDLGPELYEAFLAQISSSMLTHSLRYRNFLLSSLPRSTSHYLCAVQEGKIVGVLPLMSSGGPVGPVFNSLPFFGSHGGLLLLPNSGIEVARALLDMAESVCLENGAFSLTIVESPFGSFSHTALELWPTDERIGQVTALPRCLEDEQVDQVLMDRFHGKTRNAIRKASKIGYEVSVENTREAFKDLWAIHGENMVAIGGKPKDSGVIDAIWSAFEPKKDFQLYLAKEGSQTISALLVFYYEDFVEYWMPVTKESHRSNQPLSLLIFTAMRDAVMDRKMSYWNWGGTWKSQSGVYSFKSRWGTRDFPYSYFTRVFREGHLLVSDFESLLPSYPGFYIAPLASETGNFEKKT